MRYIKYSNDKKKLDELIKTEIRFRNVERNAVEIINAATNSNVKIDEGKDLVDMCLAIQEMKEESRIEGRNEGRIEGRNEGRIEGRNEGRIEGEIEGAITFAKELGVSRDEVKKSFMARY